MANSNGHKTQASSTVGVGFARKLLATDGTSASSENSEPTPGVDPPDRAPSEQKDLDKIRDILFGQQVKTHEQRFEQLEQKVEEATARLSSQFNQRLSALEDRLVEHVDRLAEQIRTEERDRKVADERLGQTFSDKVVEFSHQTSKIDERLTETRQEVLAELKHEIATLQAALESQIEEIVANLEQESNNHQTNLEQERKKLSGLFNQMAQQLEGER